MERIWQWTWDRYGPRYSWAIWAIVFTGMVSTAYPFLSFIVVAAEDSHRYVEVAVVTIIGVLLLSYAIILPGSRTFRRSQRWAAGHDVDRMAALKDTYVWTRAIAARALCVQIVLVPVLLVVVGTICGASGSRLVQYGILGAATGIGMTLIGFHTSVQGAMRPVRAALAGDTGIGDALPRSHPTFVYWLEIAMIAAVFSFTIMGALLATVLDHVNDVPVLAVVIGLSCAAVAAPITVGAIVSPSLTPIRDLAEGTERVAAGDFSRRLPVVQDDDLGALAASFNRMQAGLAERQRLQAAFGTYVDPALAARLLEQGDDVFSGERREVTVMFVDIRDFTPFAETNPAEEVVARLNALFEIVVPAVVDAGGHVNKFLGDGALAVFGAPNELAAHADVAVDAALLVHRLVVERFGGALRTGIGVNTGVVIAGTIGGGSKLEFTLIGDAVNVAARVEQLTKITGDAILLTEHTVDGLRSAPPGLIDRGPHALKGKSAEVHVFALDPDTD